MLALVHIRRLDVEAHVLVSLEGSSHDVGNLNKIVSKKSLSSLLLVSAGLRLLQPLKPTITPYRQRGHSSFCMLMLVLVLVLAVLIALMLLNLLNLRLLLFYHSTLFIHTTVVFLTSSAIFNKLKCN